MGDQDFFVSDANSHAFEMVRADHAWPEGKLALIGPEGSGKTHLARVWAAQAGATILDARCLADAPLTAEPGARICVEDVDRLPGCAEETLFHLHNNVLGSGGRLLVTGRTAPARWAIALADLASRMNAATVVTIGDPDDDLLRAILTKLFADRQLTPDPKLIQWLLPRMERSFLAADRIVSELDNRALSEARVINSSLAREILDTFPAGEGE
ncbi:chromosomal replication initiator DnaA [Ponticoccus sp. SC2-23]|uniref:chromosomal replication initiator DnaA n=1 Tax=Alexandriicola marinus TaxID=2081710 RepID=UPI000FDA1FDA|nr:chromosomal replication initiator DnaA [Alexandriicola marinus]MBM1219666.1 chromosomal replication initiator DnaA [Ponticoccus sp. SC6-9]MBM1223262.1 chromosomal replication initiator DnaA [Ponticoccus sp. SC6-15]MBM1229479.1 chromosomal replication initiator DnaA [Ponticoccus sp. SC6-38]MBM1232228.1 chromosomal replication initiator DnaA [Ponticoccus sp. SC6-45]MBM1237822.1 chromosomal replication initiator DnaA [Ponticoccus sp. SC6-49]MBM1241239.1 chromosomal replication initiator DnaA 